MKVKFMKKLIATICAAVMATSCAVCSVGAVKTSEEASNELVKKVGSLNVKIDGYESLCKEVSGKLLHWVHKLENKLKQNPNEVDKAKINNARKIIKYLINKVDIIWIGRWTYLGDVSFNKLRLGDDEIIYDESDIDEIIAIPDDKPSNPSIKFIAFVIPTIHIIVIPIEKVLLKTIFPSKNGKLK